MIKTQVQIPDHLYLAAKRIAREYELSFAEVVRRGIEKVIPAFPARQPHAKKWQLPTLSLRLKSDPFADPAWRENANLSAGAAHELAKSLRREAERLEAL